MLVTLINPLGCMFLSLRGVLLMQIFLLILVNYSVLLSELTWLCCPEIQYCCSAAFGDYGSQKAVISHAGFLWINSCLNLKRYSRKASHRNLTVVGNVQSSAIHGILFQLLMKLLKVWPFSLLSIKFLWTLITFLFL